jgi:hypothetical protein
MPTIAIAKEMSEVVSTTPALELTAALRETHKRILLVDRDQVSSLAGLLETVEGQYDYILIACAAPDPMIMKLEDQPARPAAFDFETFAPEGPRRWLGLSA